MALKIKLSRGGAKKKPHYQVVVAEARSKRNGKNIANIGFYNPLTSPPTVKIDKEKLKNWLEKGAKPTASVRRILNYKEKNEKTT